MTRKSIRKNYRDHFNNDKNKLEWIVFFCGTIVLLALVIYLSVHWVRYDDDEVNLSVSWKQEKISGEIPRYEATLHNKGGKTVKQVHLTAINKRQGNAVEEAKMLIDLSPRRSNTKAWFQFRESAKPGDSISVHISGYQ